MNVDEDETRDGPSAPPQDATAVKLPLAAALKARGYAEVTGLSPTFSDRLGLTGAWLELGVSILALSTLATIGEVLGLLDRPGAVLVLTGIYFLVYFYGGRPSMTKVRAPSVSLLSSALRSTPPRSSFNSARPTVRLPCWEPIAERFCGQSLLCSF